MATVIGVYNRKGGVGKTHSAINISCTMAMKGRRVLLIDGDSQINVTKRLFEQNENLFDFDDPDYPLDVRPNVTTLYEVLAEGENIYNAIHTVEYSVKRKVVNRFKKIDCIADVLICRKAIDQLEVTAADMLYKELSFIRDKYDYILIDFPPALSDLTYMYMAACDYMIVPSESGNNDSTDGYKDVLNAAIMLFDAGDNPNIDILGMFYTKVMTYKSNQKDILNISDKEKEEIKLLTSFIHHDYGATEKMQKTHQPICICAPRSIAAKDYENLVNEIIERLEA